MIHLDPSHYVTKKQALALPVKSHRHPFTEIDNVPAQTPNVVSTSTATIVTPEYDVVLCDTTSTDILLTLLPISLREGKPLTIVKISDDTNKVVIVPDSTDEAPGELELTDQWAVWNRQPHNNTWIAIDEARGGAKVPPLSDVTVTTAEPPALTWNADGTVSLTLSYRPTYVSTSPVDVGAFAGVHVSREGLGQPTILSTFPYTATADNNPANDTATITLNLGRPSPQTMKLQLLAYSSTGESMAFLPYSIAPETRTRTVVITQLLLDSNPVQTVTPGTPGQPTLTVSSAEDAYMVNVSWSAPAVLTSIVGYQVQIKYWDNISETVVGFDWADLGNVPGKNTLTGSFGPLPPQNIRRWSRARVRSLSDAGKYSDWSELSALQVVNNSAIYTPDTNMPVSPLNYNAVGNGEADDTEAMLACFAANSAVYIPAGYVFLTDPLTITAAGDFLMNGSGTIKRRTGTSTAPLVSIAAGGIVTLADTTYDGNRFVQGAAVNTNIVISSAAGVELSWVSSYEATGRALDVAAAATSARLSDCNFSPDTCGTEVQVLCEYTSYNCTGLADRRVDIAAPPIPTLQSGVPLLVVDEYGRSFGVTWTWVPPADITNCVGFVRQYKYERNDGTDAIPNWVIDSDWGDDQRSESPTANQCVAGPWPKVAGKYRVYGRIASVNADGGRSSWVTGAAQNIDPYNPTLSAIDPPVEPTSVAITCSGGGTAPYSIKSTIVLPTQLGSIVATRRTVHFFVSPGIATSESHKVLTELYTDLTDLTPTDGPYPTVKSDYWAEMWITTLNGDLVESAPTKSNRVKITGNPKADDLDSDLRDITFDTSYQDTANGWKGVGLLWQQSHIAGQINIKARYEPPLDGMDQSITTLLKYVEPWIEVDETPAIMESSLLTAYPHAPYLGNPGGDAEARKGYIQITNVPVTTKTIYLHGIGESLKGSQEFRRVRSILQPGSSRYMSLTLTPEQVTSVGDPPQPPPPPSGQPPSWTVFIDNYSMDQGTKIQKGRVVIVLPPPDPAVGFYTAYRYKGSAAPTDPNLWQEFAGYDPDDNTKLMEWMDRPDADTTYQCCIVASGSNRWKLPTEAGFTPYVQSFTLTKWAYPAQVSGCSVTQETRPCALGTETRTRFEFTAPTTDLNYYGCQVRGNWRTSTWTQSSPPTEFDQDGGYTFFQSPSWSEWGLAPEATEYHQMEFRSLSTGGQPVLTPAPPVVNYTHVGYPKVIAPVDASATPPANLRMHPTDTVEPFGVFSLPANQAGLTQWYAYVRWDPETGLDEKRSKLVFEWVPATILPDLSWIPASTARPLASAGIELGGADLPGQNFAQTAQNALLIVRMQSKDGRLATCATLKFVIPAGPTGQIDLSQANFAKTAGFKKNASGLFTIDPDGTSLVVDSNGKLSATAATVMANLKVDSSVFSVNSNNVLVMNAIATNLLVAALGIFTGGVVISNGSAGITLGADGTVTLTSGGSSAYLNGTALTTGEIGAAHIGCTSLTVNGNAGVSGSLTVGSYDIARDFNTIFTKMTAHGW